MLQDMGHALLIHTVVTGGQALSDTVSGFCQLTKQFPEGESQFVVWLNPYWGDIAYEGKSFEQMKAYTENKHRVASLIQIPPLKKETYGHDFSQMLQARLTFEEALALPSSPIMTRQRLKIIQRTLFEQMEKANIL